MLIVDSIQKTFKSRQQTVRALDGVSFTLAPGEIAVLLGRNGSGKTTTLRIISGLLIPDSGEVRINGQPPSGCSLGVLLDTNRVGYPRLSPLENLLYLGVVRGFPPPKALEKARYWLERVGLSDKQKAPVQTLSKGMLSKLALASALLHDPPFLLLDEPTLGLDLEAADNLEKIIREVAHAGKAVLLTTHQMEVAARLATRVLLIEQGRLITDTPLGSVRDLAQAHSYRIRLTQPPDESRLRTFEYRLDGSQLEVLVSEPSQWYRLLDALRPIPILEISPIETDVALLLRKLVLSSGEAL